ncbi:bi-domain-containing oxidoreductase [Nocardioides sp. TF02-7]|uniref:bi-domain-containing oxidoreductase n=1 Tax=Nocardioides sp. TF02-7 TaxID=2917724 RepID=UPI001F0522DF|nr:bi-domain-containing oxidoreductase [Nocardioides sp. TF02-7]UMG91541.1 Gfo/Idh/MocA family oxidoreductase [Nocardioides sp. TF02-7]
MKQVAQNYRSGELVVLEAPVPATKPGGVLVRSLFSLISTGTELMKVSEARMSLLGKAKARPDQVRKLAESVAHQGPVAAYQKAMNRLDSYTPLGYSLCGVVVEVGPGAEDEFAVGDLVAAAGNEFALHAEFNWVPTNLCVRVPDGVAPEHAAFATVGAIAMQGVRRAETQLGETACVIGLGLVGQLVVRLLVAAGVRVVGVDTVPDRCRLAEKAGALLCAGPDPEGLARLEGVLGADPSSPGADHVFLAAGGASNGPVEVAARLARDRARVVDIGKTRLDLPWNAYYEKELDLRFSRSYGPGRYDDRYELEGVDYPAGYVRWTERRNLGCFLDLIAADQVEVGSWCPGSTGSPTPPRSTSSCAPVRPPGSVSSWSTPDPAGAAAPAPALGAARTVERRTSEPAPPVGRRPVRIGFVGAGNYASSMLLPHLAKDPGVDLVSVATTRSLSAVNAQRKFGFATASTDADTVLSDPAVDLVFVVTRHHSHADLVCTALEHGKSVFVEKPLALTVEQLDRVRETVARTGNDRLVVGFNRRFAPLFVDLRRRFGATTGPVSARYLVNAGRLDASSWYLDSELEGSRFLGEGGHFIDTLVAWTGSTPTEVWARQTPGGLAVHAAIRFADGSLADITYATDGHGKFPKETLDVTGCGRNARLDNFTRATVWGSGGKDAKRAPHRPGQGPGRAAAPAGRCRPRRRADADPPGPPARHDPRHHRRPAEPGLRRAGAPVSRSLTWYARRLRQMGPGEVVARGRDQARQAAWARRQVRSGDPVAVPRLVDPPHVRGGPPARRAGPGARTRRRCPRRGGRRVAGRDLGRARHGADGPGVARLVPRPGHRSSFPVEPVRLPDRPPRRAGDREREVGVGALPAPPPDRPGDGVLAHPGRAVRRAGRPAPPLVVGRQPVPLRDPLDQWDRAGGPAAELGLGAAAAGRLAEGSGPLRVQRARARPAPLAPGAPGRLPQLRVVGQQPPGPRGGRPGGRRLRVPVVRGERQVAARRDRRVRGGVAGQHLRQRGEPGARHGLPPVRRGDRGARRCRGSCRRDPALGADLGAGGRGVRRRRGRPPTRRAVRPVRGTVTKGAPCWSTPRPRTPGGCCSTSVGTPWARCRGGRRPRTASSARPSALSPVHRAPRAPVPRDDRPPSPTPGSRC